MSQGPNSPVVGTAENFETEVLGSSLPVVVDFWAPWCGPCRAIGPVLEKLAETYAGRVKVVKVNVDEENALAGAFKVRSIPTLIAMHNREVVNVQVGFSGPAALEAVFEELSSATSTETAAAV